MHLGKVNYMTSREEILQMLQKTVESLTFITSSTIDVGWDKLTIHRHTNNTYTVSSVAGEEAFQVSIDKVANFIFDYGKKHLKRYVVLFTQVDVHTGIDAVWKFLADPDYSFSFEFAKLPEVHALLIRMGYSIVTYPPNHQVYQDERYRSFNKHIYERK